jgi:3-hydroxybutyryl-CoA dehydrogenase
MDFRRIKNILIIGAGTMGWQIALLFAQHRFNVWITDANSDQLRKARTNIEDNLNRRIAKGHLKDDEKVSVLEHLTFIEKWESIASQVDCVEECVFENLAVKQQIFTRLANLVQPGTICGTNSSTIGVNYLIEKLPKSFTDFCMNIHFSNPPLRLRIVEIYSYARNEDLEMFFKRFFRKIRYEVVIFKKPVKGFVMNRILGGAFREMFYLLDNDICTPEDIDIATTVGLNWPMGGARLADMVGLDVIYDSFRASFEDEPASLLKPSAYLEKLVKSGRLGWKSGQGIYEYRRNSP